MPHPLAGVSASLTDTFGRAATYTARGAGSGSSITARFQSARAQETRGRTQQRIATTCDIYLDLAQVATRPERGATIECTDGTAWDGVWTVIADADPKSGNWRCACVREEATHTIAAAAGSPRPGGG